MKKEAKEYLKNSSGILIFAIIIIGVVIFSNLTNFPSEELNFIIILLAVVIIWQVFSQALRYESKELQQKVLKAAMLALILLAILGVVVFFIVSL